jgi:predicted GH43/DUF377 family glycosyl hydrolase
MIQVKRHLKNPILSASNNSWEKHAVFNPGVVKDANKYHMLYRAWGEKQIYFGKEMELHTIGYAESSDGIKFGKRRQLIVPEKDWERWGCEDPRVTKIDDKYYILYTALSDFPHTADGIKVGLATTKDFKKIISKHLVTHFNAKGASLFPEKINGKYTMTLTVNTDKPPSKMLIAQFEKMEDIWNKNIWDKYLKKPNIYSIELQRHHDDHIEAGAPPVKTKEGWLFIYSYIKNYKNPPPTFGVEAVVLDQYDPYKIIYRTDKPFMIPEKKYEKEGKVGNIVFPTSVLKKDKKLQIYYGAADTSIALAEVKTKELMDNMINKEVKLERFMENPIITPKPGSSWESKYTFNPAAILLDNKVHIIYRAMNDDDKSSLGYAVSSDGLHIDERLHDPIYVSREDTEKRINPIYYSCEDPRMTILGDKIYMCYTAFDGKSPTVVAFTYIAIKDFLNRYWNWNTPRIISNPKISNKNTCVFPDKVNGKYVFLHRLEHKIWLDYVDDLSFSKKHWLEGKPIILPREHMWDSEKIGIAGPPHKTDEGWLLVYHGLSKHDKKYRLSAVLLQLDKPEKVLARLDYPILEPDAPYEQKGVRPGTVFANGSVILNDRLYVYYGAGDETLAVAHCNFDQLLSALLQEKKRDRKKK